jgi:hypothetical protein
MNLLVLDPAIKTGLQIAVSASGIQSEGVKQMGDNLSPLGIATKGKGEGGVR